MDKKAMLKKLFARYAEQGAHSASLRGCHEPSVPSGLVKKNTLAHADHKQAKNR